VGLNYLGNRKVESVLHRLSAESEHAYFELDGSAQRDLMTFQRVQDGDMITQATFDCS